VSWMQISVSFDAKSDPRFSRYACDYCRQASSDSHHNNYLVSLMSKVEFHCSTHQCLTHSHVDFARREIFSPPQNIFTVH
jgi:hypothetical protein